MMRKQAVICNNIITPRYSLCSSRTPIPGILLIEGEFISEILALPPGSCASSVLSAYPAHSILHFEDYHISPGTIDLNVRCQDQSLSSLTKSAVSGGTTLLLLEKSFYNAPVHLTELYCDLCESYRTNCPEIPDSVTAEYSAIKVFLTSPAENVGKFTGSLTKLLARAQDLGLPVIFDPVQCPDRELYAASPFRDSTFEVRASAPAEFLQGDSGAFADSPVRSSEDSPPFPVSQHQERRRLTRTDYRNLTVITDLTSSRVSMNKSRTICAFEDLDKRINENTSTETILSQAEASKYSRSGSTVYSPVTKIRCRSYSFELESDLSPQHLPEAKASFRRPTLLLVIKEEKELDHSYLQHLANIPESWEYSGTKAVVSAYKKLGKKPTTHVCNLSSAKAINLLRRAKAWGHSITCETAPHYVLFDSDMIPDGRTLFKDFPPIRDPNNRKVLLELLQLNSVDVIASHHALISQEMKFLATGSFKRALYGVDVLQNALPGIWTAIYTSNLVKKEYVSRYLVKLAEWMSYHPAKVLGIEGRYGSIEPGKLASFIVWDPYEVFVADFEPSESSIYQGRRLHGSIVAVYIRGQLAYNGQKHPPIGRKFAFQTNSNVF